jgi:EAL domain-containing protein (putative c-di-GMP-specific phosphodiesterase class I)/CheY-like chemotaxis protein
VNTYAFSKFRCLIVEDDEVQRDALELLLTNIGVRHVVHSPHGQNALTKLQDEGDSLDIVFCDLSMPEMDGMEFLRHLGKMKRKLMVVLISAKGRALIDSSLVMAKEYGVNILGGLEKPVSRSQLLDIVDQYLAASKTGDEPVLVPPTKEEILDAFSRSEFVPYFQPRVEVASGRVVAMEAMLYWNRPTHGVVPVSAIQSAMETFGFVDKLIWINLVKSATVCRHWRKQGKNLPVCIDISLSSLSLIGLAERIIELVSKLDIEPSSLNLGIRGDKSIPDFGLCLENLVRLRMAGFQLSVHDFGAAAWSIQYLAQIPFTEIKIARSFAQGALGQEAIKTIFKSALDVAANLKLRVIADGVDSIAVWDLVRELDVHVVQGSFISDPLPAAAVMDWLSSWQPPKLMTPKPPPRRLDILLVEDEDLQREIYQSHVRHFGLGSVDVAADMNQAVELLAQNRYDVVITDIELGDGRTGLDLALDIRACKTKASPDTKIVLLSSHTDNDFVHLSIVLDVNGFLRKPADPSSLKRAIQRAVAEEFTPHSPLYYIDAIKAHTQDQHVSASILRPEPTKQDTRAPSSPNGKKVHIKDLKSGMVVSWPVYTSNNRLIISPGHILSISIINRLLDISDDLQSQYLWVELDPLFE